MQARRETQGEGGGGYADLELMVEKQRNATSTHFQYPLRRSPGTRGARTPDPSSRQGEVPKGDLLPIRDFQSKNTAAH